MIKYTGTGKPVVVKGVHYESQAEAARALNLTRSAICRSVRLGTLDTVGLYIDGKKPIVWNGVQFPSIREAIIGLGITHQRFTILRRRQAEEQGKKKDA